MSPMTPERWQRVTSIVDQALACDPRDRDAFLQDVCAGDEQMRREVESLLRYDDVDLSILEPPVVVTVGSDGLESTSSESPKSANPGHRFGPYRILKRLGEGGMGTVFLAAREGAFQKQVALKRIQRRRASDQQFLYRFENERQILADLEHPNIARILDGGVAADGLPYFTMEYVNGLPIDSYCDQHELGVEARLRLVLEVCSALQLAHQNLVVHRDLKPGNILVNADGVPKLIDFGIAKHLEPEGAPHDVATRTGHGPMTLHYASPEQLQSQPITTAADIYSLGVLLYRLLTGQHPYPYDRGFPEFYRDACQREPVKPSLAVSATQDRREPKGRESAGPDRSSGSGKLSSRLVGDLDSIVLKALRKRPEDRYRSVEQLAEDLRRHLAGLPVSACEGTFSYLAGKFVRRHRRALAIATGILLILTACGLAVTLLWRQNVVESRQTEIARAQTEQARARAQRTADLLVDMIEIFDPSEAGNRITPREFLDRAQEEIKNDLRADPELLAELLSDSLAKVYRRLGHYDEALSSLGEALVILRTLYPEDHPKLADVRHNQGSIRYRTGDYNGAEADWRQTLAMRQRLKLNSAVLVPPLVNLATILAHRGAFEEAANLYQQALDIQREVLEKNDPSIAMNLRNLGNMRFVQGQQEQSEAFLHQALKIQVKAHGAMSLEVAASRNLLAKMLYVRGDLEAAEEELARSLEVRRLQLEFDHVDLARTEKTLALILLRARELPTVEVLLSNAQVALRRSKPATDWEIADLESLIGAYLTEIGDYAAAESCLVESYQSLNESRGADVIYTRQALSRVIRLYEAWGRPRLAADYRAILDRGSQ